MELIADTHLHLYPCYDLDQAFSLLLDRLVEQNPQAIFATCLAERSGCHFYQLLLRNNLSLQHFTIEKTDNKQLVLQRNSDQQRVLIFPGRQIVAAEGIEVLALCTDALFADGLPAAELIRSILKKNGVPVLPWSPGKWFFQRGKVIATLLQDFTPQDFLLGDVSLRPQGWPLPFLMRRARKLGYTIIHGSDPLPFSGEEKLFGSYGSRLISENNSALPNTLLHQLLKGEVNVTSFGHRSNLLELMKRLRHNAATRKQSTLEENKL